MFRVQITPQARAALEKRMAACASTRPGLLVHRAAPPDSRSAFACQLACFETYPENELLDVDGVRVYLVLVPRANEKGVRIECRKGSLRAERIP